MSNAPWLEMRPVVTKLVATPFEIALPPGATEHGHKLRIVDEHDAYYVEVTEPGGCECLRRIALSELVHLLLNLPEDEQYKITTRDLDAAGHQHEVAKSIR